MTKEQLENAARKFYAEKGLDYTQAACRELFWNLLGPSIVRPSADAPKEPQPVIAPSQHWLPTPMFYSCCGLSDHAGIECAHGWPWGKVYSWRMNAYYYRFQPTGVAAIDKILSAVACAGKAFHNTENWDEKIENAREPHANNASPVDWIQIAANEAAALIAAPKSVTVPEGWQLVPIKPTKEMLDALYIFPKTHRSYIIRHSVTSLPDAYATMLKAAPTLKESS